MEGNSLIYMAKPTVFVNFSDSKSDFRTGCCVIDITFPNTFYVEIAEIHLKNYYTSWFTLKVKLKSSAGKLEDKFKTCVRRFQMMPDAHADNCAEDYFTLTNKHFLFPLHNITALRFVLHQPSPIWKSFKIDDMRFHKLASVASSDVSLPKWLTTTHSAADDDTEKTLKQIPSIPSLSQSLQQMWALTNQSHENQSKARIGRCDVDGCYDISLLSYT